ncbi:phosphatidate cytidylyltransferase [Campylobacter sp. FMV-PI01]|uniref:Phosphatidate cytidylyltransferase n=1 Tax=Campylobacter portucalensis TaxID=2608384 RepID=A0A6L5WIV1_9BACT|nr:phosphatidate cytidylyltransferase [Campylobacter portucalensis]MSN95925.1 phosphatidate cytidylyltransferase [Campylobacter portucalensis]
MKTRIKTASVMILALGLALWLDLYLVNLIIFCTILAFCISESLKIYSIDNKILVFLSVILFIIYAAFIDKNFVSIYKFMLFLLLVYSSFLVFKKSDDLKPLLPLIYPMTPILVMFGIYEILGIASLIFLILVVSLADSGAYFVGKAFGKHKFSLTSPNKTIEGTIGGAIISILGGLLYYTFFMDKEALPNPTISTIFIVFASIFGDLFESYLKRNAGVKDSGNLFPGHGGMLDRLDGYLFASIAMSICVEW